MGSEINYSLKNIFSLEKDISSSNIEHERNPVSCEPAILFSFLIKKTYFTQYVY